MSKDRFVYVMARKNHTEAYNIFYIKDKKGKIPRMHFLTEYDMRTVYELLTSLSMWFDEKDKIVLGILDAYILGLEDEKGIDHTNEKFQYAMNHTIKVLERLKEDIIDPTEYLQMQRRN